MHPAVDLRVLRARLQVLADRHDVDAVRAQVAQRLDDLVVRLAEADDDPRLREHADSRRSPSRAAGARAPCRSRPCRRASARCRRRTVSMLWLKTSGRAPITVCSASSSTPRKSGVSTSTDACGQLRLDRADRRRVVRGAPVGDVVAVDRGDDDVLQLHLRRGLRDAQRLERVGRRVGLARVDVAVAAGARARVAEDLERRGAAAPALGDVRAARLLADRVQREAVDELLHVEVLRRPSTARAPSSTRDGAAVRRRGGSVSMTSV